MTVNNISMASSILRTLKELGNSQNTSMQRLASGTRLNSAADDPAGLAILSKMHAQIRGMDAAARNAQDGISLIQTAEGGLKNINDILIRARELTVQAATDTLGSEERAVIGNQIKQLFEEIDGIAGRTDFNGKKLLNGNYAGNKIFLQVGANAGQSIQFNIAGVSVSALGLDSVKSVLGNFGSMTGAEISDLITMFDDAQKLVSEEQSKLGALNNRLGFTIRNLDNQSVNLSAAASRIGDTDMAKEMMNLTRINVLTQVSIAMLAQYQQQSENILWLVKR